MKNLLCLIFLAGSALAQNLPQPASGNVTLPLEEFNRLNELALRIPKPDATPFPHILKSAYLNLRVNPESLTAVNQPVSGAVQSVTGAIQLEGEVFTKGDRKVPLVRDMIVLDAQQRGRELPLQNENAIHSALLAGPGEFMVTLQAAVPLLIEPGRASFKLTVPDAGAARLTLSVPGDQTQVVLTPGIITGRSTQNGQTIVEATLIPGQVATVWWASRLSSSTTQAVHKEARFLSEIRTLVSVSEAELAIAALAHISVVQGQPAEFRLQSPPGYELTGATGASLLSSEIQGESVVLHVADPAARTHDFLITFAKSNVNLANADVPLLSVEATQRETGEVLIEGDGAMELTALEKNGLRRMDLKETSPDLRALSRATLQAAFRYQKRPAENPALALAWVRFADSHVLAAVAQRAEVTTLVTSEGRSLTEIKLSLKNQSQPFLKVQLPPGASILYSEVAGQSVKPVQGADGSRVPLLRAGFRPTGEYFVSFVILNPDGGFAKKGNTALTLPKMDVPIAQVNWEVFLPQQFKVANFAGDVSPAHWFPSQPEDEALLGAEVRDPGPGVLSGVVTDQAGGVIAGASVIVTHGRSQFTAVTNSQGRWTIAGVPSGRITILFEGAGFRTTLKRNVEYDSNRRLDLQQTLTIGSVSETVEVEVSAAKIALAPAQQRDVRQNAASTDNTGSINVSELQKKVVGVLPIAIKIPRTGNSYRFLRTLVVDEETKLSFAYRTR